MKTYTSAEPDNTFGKTAGADSPQKNKSKKERRRPRASTVILSVLVAVLTAALITESVLFAVTKVKKDALENAPDKTVVNQITVSADMSSLGAAIGSAVADNLSDIFNRVSSGSEGIGDRITNAVHGVVFSSDVVDLVMSIGYPLLKQILEGLGMIDFAEQSALRPTPASLAGVLTGKGYLATDRAGAVRALEDVLTEAGEDWGYFDAKNAEGKSLWSLIDWNITGGDSFYKAMGDMSEGLRGVIEVCLQGRSRTVTVNAVEVVLKNVPFNYSLDAAELYSPHEQSGYEACLVPLFGALGLDGSDYPAVSAFCAYDDLSHVWRGIVGSVLTAVEKAKEDPATRLCSMLVNFADLITSGALRDSMTKMSMCGRFDPLAKSFMGFEDKELFNLGETLIDTAKSLGIDLSGSFNDILDDLLVLITKEPSAKMPKMDVKELIERCTVKTLSNGGKVYEADPKRVISYLCDYLIDEDNVALVLSFTDLHGTETEKQIIRAVDKSEEGLDELAAALVPLLFDKVLAKDAQ
ncbi:MAG: hypothetical protein IJM45_00085 [Clostridia bacterium]|nr:hypothetical protein [Clostridia bacterium]